MKKFIVSVIMALFAFTCFAQTITFQVDIEYLKKMYDEDVEEHVYITNETSLNLEFRATVYDKEGRCLSTILISPSATTGRFASFPMDNNFENAAKVIIEVKKYTKPIIHDFADSQSTYKSFSSCDQLQVVVQQDFDISLLGCDFSLKDDDLHIRFYLNDF